MMTIKAVRIERQTSYAGYKPNEMVGTITLEGPTGKQEVFLSSGALSRVFRVISEEVSQTAKSNAAMVPAAMDEGVNGPLLANSATVDA
jgi:hypothetical protein